MQINTKLILSGLIVISCSVLITLSIGSVIFKSNIVYVRSQELIYNYEGTIEAMTKFNRQKQQWQGSIDTLQIDLQRSINQYNREYNSLSLEQRRQKEELLSKQEYQFQTYSSAIKDKIANADEEMMNEVLDQINVFVEEYGQKKGYDFILGTTSTGNLLYGLSDKDITDDLLIQLNKKYKGI